MITCYNCGTTDPAAFGKDSRADSRGWLSRECKNCHNDRSRLTVTPEQRRERGLFGRYGITTEQYNEMLASQHGVCKICHKPPKNKPLYVDHDHETGEVRGLLCAHCNSCLEWMLIHGDAAQEYLSVLVLV